MKFPELLKTQIELESETEFNNPTEDFGDRMREIIHHDTGEILGIETNGELNTWQDVWLDPMFTWADFVRWVWQKIKEWWDAFWN